MNVEVSEENNEGRGIRDEGVMHPLGEVAVDVQGVHTVQSGSTKLQLRRERGEGRGGKGRMDGHHDKWEMQRGPENGEV